MSAVCEQEWRARVSRWERSGLRRGEFAREEGVNPRTLSWWRWWLRKEQERVVGPAVRMVELVGLGKERAEGGRSSSGLELGVGAYRVQLDRDFDGGVLVRLLDVLEGRP